MNEPTTTTVVKKVRLRRTLSLIAAAALAMTGIGLIANSASATGGGNNGTLKIHEKGTPSGTESNDPKVCEFNVEGFGFDAGQTGYLVFTTQGGDKPTGTNAGPYAWGPANSAGFYATQYFNLDAGHYKATLYGKMLPGGQLKDVKAKSKVFKVKCGETTPPTTTTTSTTTSPTSSTTSSSSTTTTPPEEFKYKRQFDKGCNKDEEYSFIDLQLSEYNDAVTNHVKLTVNGEVLWNDTFGFLYQNTELLSSLVDNQYKLDVTAGDDTNGTAAPGGSFTESGTIKACQTSETSTTTTGTPTKSTTSTETKTTSSTPSKTTSSSPSKTSNVPVPVSTSTTTKNSYPVAAHTGGSGDNTTMMKTGGIAALVLAALIFLVTMSRGRSTVTAQQPRRR